MSNLGRVVYRRTATGWKALYMILDVVQAEALASTKLEAQKLISEKVNAEKVNACLRKIARQLLAEK